MQKKKKTKAERILRQPSPILIMVDQKQSENVEYLKNLGSMITNDAFNKKKTLFTSKPYLNLKKTLVKCYIWTTALYGAGN